MNKTITIKVGESTRKITDRGEKWTTMCIEYFERNPDKKFVDVMDMWFHEQLKQATNENKAENE